MPRKTHAAKHPLYYTWRNMKSRCGSAASDCFDHYGGRGIKVCERWMAFDNFLEDMGERPAGHSLDRINNDGDYEPSNVRWATRTEQLRNTRRNVFLTIEGETKCISEWCEVYGIAAAMFRKRIALGWPPDKAVSAPKFTRRYTIGIPPLKTKEEAP